MARVGDPDLLAPVIGELLAAYGSQRIDPKTTAAKTAGYLEALYDVPLWAVSEALARWRRGEAGSDVREDEYDFAPSTVRLRRLALRIASVAAGQAIRLQRLLDAEPDVPLTDEQMRRQAEKLQALVADAAEKPATPARLGVAPEEQEARDRETRAYWQRVVAEQAQQEAPADDAA